MILTKNVKKNCRDALLFFFSSSPSSFVDSILILFNLPFNRINKTKNKKRFCILTCYIIQYLEAIYVLMVHAVYQLRHNHLDSILVYNHSTPILCDKKERKDFFLCIIKVEKNKCFLERKEKKNARHAICGE